MGTLWITITGNFPTDKNKFLEFSTRLVDISGSVSSVTMSATRLDMDVYQQQRSGLHQVTEA